MKLEIEYFMNIISDPYILNLPDIGLILLDGRNGSGKTTIMKAISWCMYGKVSDVLPKTELKSVKRSTSVKLTMGHPGTDSFVRIIRSNNPVKLTIERCAMMDVLPGSQEVINNIFGSESLWMSHSYLPHRSNHVLIKSTSTDRYDVLSGFAFGTHNGAPFTPETFMERIKDHIKSTTSQYIKLNSVNEHLRGEYLNKFNEVFNVEANNVNVKELKIEYSTRCAALKMMEDDRLRISNLICVKDERRKRIDDLTKRLSNIVIDRSLEYLNIEHLQFCMLSIGSLDGMSAYKSSDQVSRLCKLYEMHKEMYDIICIIGDIDDCRKVICDNESYLRFNKWSEMNIKWLKYEEYLKCKFEIEEMSKVVVDTLPKDPNRQNVRLITLKDRLKMEIVCPKCKHGFNPSHSVEGSSENDRNCMIDEIKELEILIFKIVENQKVVKCLEDLNTRLKMMGSIESSIDPGLKPSTCNIPEHILSIGMCQRLKEYANNYEMYMIDNLLPSMYVVKQGQDWMKIVDKLNNVLDSERPRPSIDALKSETSNRLNANVIESELEILIKDYENMIITIFDDNAYRCLIEDIENMNCDIEKGERLNMLIDNQRDVDKNVEILESMKRLKKISEDKAGDGLKFVMHRLTSILNVLLKRMFTTSVVTINICECEIKCVSDKVKSRKIDIMLYKNDVAWSKLECLSGGEKMMLSLAMCVSMSMISNEMGMSTTCNGSILMLDEIFNDIDMVNREVCLEILREHSMNKCIINVCHDIDSTNHTIIKLG